MTTAVAVNPDALDWRRLRLRGARLLVDKVVAVGRAQEYKLPSGLIAPAQIERSRRTYGLLARVLAVGPGCVDLRVDDEIIIDEFGGRPVWWKNHETPYWIVGEGEVQCVIRPDGDGADISSAEAFEGATLEQRYHQGEADDTPMSAPTEFRIARK